MENLNNITININKEFNLLETHLSYKVPHFSTDENHANHTYTSFTSPSPSPPRPNQLITSSSSSRIQSTTSLNHSFSSQSNQLFIHQQIHIHYTTLLHSSTSTFPSNKYLAKKLTCLPSKSIYIFIIKTFINMYPPVLSLHHYHLPPNYIPPEPPPLLQTNGLIP